MQNNDWIHYFARHGYNFEEFLEYFEMHPFIDKASFVGRGKTISTYGRLTFYFFLLEKESSNFEVRTELI